MQWNLADLEALPQRYRAQMINSLGGCKNAVLVGTVDEEGQENLAIFNSLVHIGANPPLCGFIVRPDSTPRHTLENIRQTGFYSINHITQDFYKAAHETSARYAKEISEFDAVGLHTEYVGDFRAPFVAESKVRWQCEVAQIIPIELNGTLLVIGRILYIEAPDGAVEEDGYLNTESAGSIAVSGLDTYHSTKRIERLPYAKPRITSNPS